MEPLTTISSLERYLLKMVRLKSVAALLQDSHRLNMCYLWRVHLAFGISYVLVLAVGDRCTVYGIQSKCLYFSHLDRWQSSGMTMTGHPSHSSKN